MTSSASQEDFSLIEDLQVYWPQLAEGHKFSLLILMQIQEFIYKGNLALYYLVFLASNYSLFLHLPFPTRFIFLENSKLFIFIITQVQSIIMLEDLESFIQFNYLPFPFYCLLNLSFFLFCFIRGNDLLNSLEDANFQKFSSGVWR